MSDADESGNWEQCLDVALIPTTRNGGKWSPPVILSSDIKFSVSGEGKRRIVGIQQFCFFMFKH